MATSAMFPARSPARGDVRVVLPARRRTPSEPRRGVDPLHRPQAPRARRRRRGSVWCTVFDARAGRPFMHKLDHRRARAPPRRLDRGRRDAPLGPGSAPRALRRGELVAALRRARRARTAPPPARAGSTARRCRARSSRAPRPRRASTGTLAVRPARAARSSCGAGAGWSATTGAPSTPSAGSGCTGSASHEDPDAWLDVALGRVRVAGRMTPWVANGALSLDGQRLRSAASARAGCASPRRAERLRAARCPGERGLDGRRAASQVPAGTARRLALRRPRRRASTTSSTARSPRSSLTRRAARRAAARDAAQRARRRLRAGDARARPRRADRAVRRRLTARTGPPTSRGCASATSACWPISDRSHPSRTADGLTETFPSA